ncbi:restriction endonuclease subunit S [Allomuricauda sp. XS_ASV26]|uniref:restriction endonuclease subunit S n=1 Tax=Allomuricauda sp. XS_ASV26 TaxID=3241292 RepID=UPI00351895C8
MGVNWSNTKFSDVGKTHYLFSHFNYFKLRKEIDADKSFLQERISDYFEIISGYAFSSKDYSEKGTSVCRIGDISKLGDILYDEMNKLPEDYYNTFKNYQIKENDILIGMTGDGKYFKTGLVENLKTQLLLNQRVGIIRLKDKTINFNPKFLSYLLKLDKVQNQIKIVAMGKTQKNVSPFDILSVRFPKVDFERQNLILSKISPLEDEINSLKTYKKEKIEIINSVFAEEFNFNFEEFNKLKDEKIVSSSLVNFSNNIDCRFGYRFQHKSGKYMMDFLKSKTQKRIKDYVAIPISLGKSVSPSQYDEDGEYYYISMATVKKFYFDKEDAKKVSDDYSSQNLNKAVKKNDIIMTRSGMAIGKFALIKKNIKGIYADFTMRIRLQNYNHQLAYYYFRSIFFQQLITTNKKGLQNHNIFPSMIQEFPIPDWSIEKQNEICDSITKQIDEQKEIDRKIEQKQNEIKNLIENAIESE